MAEKISLTLRVIIHKCRSDTQTDNGFFPWCEKRAKRWFHDSWGVAPKSLLIAQVSKLPVVLRPRKNQWIMYNVQLIDLMIYRFADEFL